MRQHSKHATGDRAVTHDAPPGNETASALEIQDAEWASKQRIAEATAGRQPFYAVLFPFEIEELHVFSDRLLGTWVQVGAIKHITVWQFKGSGDEVERLEVDGI